jgi:hypothetical protein
MEKCIRLPTAVMGISIYPFSYEYRSDHVPPLWDREANRAKDKLSLILKQRIQMATPRGRGLANIYPPHLLYLLISTSYALLKIIIIGC